MAALPQLRLRSVRLACDFAPRRPCTDTLYAPFYFADPSPVIQNRNELLFTMGGHIDGRHEDGSPGTPQLDQSFSSPDRFADKIYYSFRQPNGLWSTPTLTIAKTFFPWMNDDNFLAAHPESFIASVAGPSVVKIGATYHMFFAATVSDPNVCTGEHPPNPNIHGSCLTPWSYFALFWATSADGQTWTLRDMGRPNANVALRHAAVYYTPSAAETVSQQFKGLAMSHGAIVIAGTIYIFIEFWSSVGLRNAIVRTSDMAQFEIWDGGAAWDPFADGLLPAWINNDVWRGNPYAHIINQVTQTNLVPGFQYLLTAQGAGFTIPGGSGNNNCIEYAASNDLVNWTPGQIVASDFPHVVDGTGSDSTVLNPIYYEDRSGYHLLWATNDYNLDGAPDCDGPYPGLAIFQGDETPPPAPVQIAGGIRRAVGHTSADDDEG